MADHRPTSFPYLAIAKAFGVDYWRVLQFADLLDKEPPKPSDWGLPRHWMIATCVAWCHERDRRMLEQPSAVMAVVRGDCGLIHSWDEWRACSVCAMVLRSRRQRGPQ